MTSVVDDKLQAGRDAIERRAWSEGADLLREADAGGELGPEDLELLGSALHWLSRKDEWFSAMERAFAKYVEAGEPAKAAFVAVALAHESKNQLQLGTANGWMSQAKRLLDEEGGDRVERGYWLLEEALFALRRHDFEEAFALSKQAEEIGRKHGDRSLEIRAIQREGAALIEKGEVAEGQRLLDEASTAAFAGELDPHTTIVVYCNTIGACRDVADFDRAGEWTDRANGFVESMHAEAFPGLCRVNRAEIMRFKGRLAEAGVEAARAAEELRAWCPRIAGAAFYEVGETHLRLGELAQAEAAFREADEHGHPPEPGLSLLRLAQGNVKAAYSGIRRALSDETLGVAARARFLPAGVEIAIAAEEIEKADAWVDELREAAQAFETSALKAAAAYARGTVALARGDADAAFPCLKQARTYWHATGATYEVARARLQLGLAARLEGDEDGASWDLEAAAARFERLGSSRDADRVAELLAVKKTVTKTFLFTDIVRSSDLLQTIEDRHWANALRRHDDALRTIFNDWEGQVVDHTGDGFFVAFEEPASALHAATAVQRTVDQEFVFDVRIGIHTDGALAKEGNYTGRGVHAAARIGAAADGREILASEVTMEPLAGFTTTNHRTIELKGFKDPVTVCSVDWERT